MYCELHSVASPEVKVFPAPSRAVPCIPQCLLSSLPHWNGPSHPPRPAPTLRLAPFRAVRRAVAQEDPFSPLPASTSRILEVEQFFGGASLTYKRAPRGSPKHKSVVACYRVVCVVSTSTVQNGILQGRSPPPPRPGFKGDT